MTDSEANKHLTELHELHELHERINAVLTKMDGKLGANLPNPTGRNPVRDAQVMAIVNLMLLDAQVFIPMFFRGPAQQTAVRTVAFFQGKAMDPTFMNELLNAVEGP